MSGSMIGGIAGGIIGFVASGYNPAGFQIGYMIGAGVGALIDPQTIQGSKWNNQVMQGSADGLARAVVFGTYPVVGNLLDSEPQVRRGTRTESAGKGGPEIKHDTALLTYAIEICDSSELRGTSVRGVIAVWEDERLVYDARENTLLSAADSAKWKKNKKFYFGEESQLPPPELELIHGVGNVPAHRGTCMMVVVDEDLMVDIKGNPRGRMPTYRFLVSACPVVEQEGMLLVTGGATGGGLSPFAMAPASIPPEFFRLDDVPGADMAGGVPAAFGNRVLVAQIGGGEGRYTNSPTTSWETVALPDYAVGIGAGSPHGFLFANSSAFTSNPSWLFVPGSGVEPFKVDLNRDVGAILDISLTRIARYIAGDYWGTAGTWYSGVSAPGELSREWFLSSKPSDHGGGDGYHAVDVFRVGDYVYGIVHLGMAGTAAELRRAAYSGARSAEGLHWVDSLVPAQTGEVDFDTLPWSLWANEEGTVIALSSNGNYAWTSDDGFSEPHPTGLNGLVNVPMTSVGEAFFIVDGAHCVTTLDGKVFSDPVPHKVAYANGIVAIGKPEYELSIPDAPGFTIDPLTGEVSGPSEVGAGCASNLEYIVRTLHRLGAPQLVNSDFSLASLAPYKVRGYAVQDAGLTAADACDPLSKIWPFDLPSYDLKIRAILRGGPIGFVINEDDLVVGEDEFDKSSRGNVVEYPKKLHLGYLDPTIDYKQTTQISERYSASVNVVGEEKLDVSIAMLPDEARQAVDKLHKILFIELEDTRSITVPIEYLRATPADLLGYRGRRYRIEKMRIEGQLVAIETAMYDRASAYSSNAVGTPGIPPAPPTSSVRGPTISAILNAPVLHDANDKAGVIWAATGPSAGWRGARLDLSRADSAYEIGPTIDKPCTMGVLVETLPAASRYGLDTANALKVKLYPGARDLNGRTFEQLIASDDNALAIRYPDGKVEILQFTTAVETAEREYTLTGLLRGRKDTTAGEHLTGAIVVLLDNDVRFVAIKPDDVGKTLNFRATSIDTDPDLAEVQTITMTTIESLREWQPYNIVVTPDGSGGFCVAWIGRGRLGTSRTPVHSQWFDGYEVRFEVGMATYIVTTADQHVCVPASALVAAFPEGYGTPVVTVRARSRVATNDDDFDSPPGGQTGGYDGSEAFALSGAIPGGYVGIPYDLRNGDAGITVGGGYWDARAFGEICPGVGAYGQFPLGSTYRSVGIPTTAGTYTATLYADASSPVPGHAGTGTITNSVAIAAKPTYSMIDMRSRSRVRNTLIATTPPWTTFDVEAISLYSYGFTVGKCRGEFTITDSDVALLVGVNAAYGDLAEGFRIGVQDGAPNQDAVLTTGDGTYAVEYDAATGDWEIFKAGTGSIATGNVPLPPGNQARIVCRPMSTDVVRVKANFGNEPWVITPSSGYGGIPMPTVTLPCAVGAHGTDTDIMRSGSGHIGATSGANPRVVNHTFGTLGKSSGRWRIGISGATWCGLAVAAYDSADGHLGASGTANSIGFNGTTLHWCFGGVHSSVSPAMPSATYRQIVFALNFTAGTVVVLVEDFDGTQTPIHTIAGLPAGTWFPAESGSARIFTFTHNPAGPDGFTNWTTTV